MSGKLSLTIVAISLLVAASLRAQPSSLPANDPPEAADIRAATKEFIISLIDKDVSRAKKLFAGNDEDFKLVEVMHDVFQAGTKLHAAAESRWPEEVKSQFQSNDLDPKALATRIDHEKVTVEGDTAKLSGGAMLKKQDGKWRVVDIMNDPMGKGMIGGMFKTLVPIMNEAATDIEAGKYPSLAKAMEAVKQKADAMMRKTLMPPGMHPTTKPAD